LSSPDWKCELPTIDASLLKVDEYVKLPKMKNFRK
jgi:hypothetical protein